MGLLDDAIREHLELRRRHGADAGLIAREEHDALGTVGDALGMGTTGDTGADHIDVSSAAGEAPGNVGQETVELDMADVLYADIYTETDTEADAGVQEPEPRVGDSTRHAPDEDEIAGLPTALPGRERLGFG